MNSIDEIISLSPYNPDWPRAFADEAVALKRSLRALPNSIEHIGSTAVPGLLAKPIIDILVGLGLYPPSDEVQRTIQALGYENLGEAGVAGRIYFRKRTSAAFNVHVTLKDGDLWRNDIALRDYLRAHPNEAEGYADWKKRAVSAGSQFLLEYSQKKEPVIREMLIRAQSWSAQQGAGADAASDGPRRSA